MKNDKLIAVYAGFKHYCFYFGIFTLNKKEEYCRLNLKENKASHLFIKELLKYNISFSVNEDNILSLNLDTNLLKLEKLIKTWEVENNDFINY